MTQEIEVVKVGVGVPCNTGLWTSKFGLSLTQMVARFAQEPVWPGKLHSLAILDTKSSMLSNMRKDIVQMAFTAGVEWLLFVDTDQTFPPDTLHRLLRHGKKVVGANVATKQLPPNPTARAKPTKEHPFGVPVYTRKASQGLEQVWRIGTGVLLLHMDVFKQIGYAAFDCPWKPNQSTTAGPGAYQGEDWSMMEEIERAGIPIWIDHDLSKQVWHVGPLEFGHQMIDGWERVDLSYKHWSESAA